MNKPKSFPALGITSPVTKGNAVVLAQTALKKNSYGDYLGKANVDGEYGALTGAAVHRAKYYLGYPSRGVDKTYNNYLHAYLTGEMKLSKLMLARRKFRLKAVKKNADKNALMRAKLLAAAGKFVGTKESPAGSNEVLFSKWYGMIGPWCAMFISYLMFVVLGLKFWRYSYVPNVLSDAMKNKSNMFVIHPEDAEPGDIFVVDWNHDGEFDHIGLVRLKKIGSKTGTREGNTGPASLSNGGMVMDEVRDDSMGNFKFIRINFAA